MKFACLFFVLFILFGCGGKPIVQEDTAKPEQAAVTDQNFKGFVNKEARVKVPYLDNFNVEVFLSGFGFVMRHNADFSFKSNGKIIPMHYVVEIGFAVEENLEKYASLSEFLLKKYPGYSYEFVANGAYVNENVADDGIRHFYKLDGKYLDHAYLKVPTVTYFIHGPWFDKWVESVVYE